MKATLVLVTLALLSLTGLTGCFGTYHDSCYDGCVSTYPSYYGTSRVVVTGPSHQYRHGGHAAVRVSSGSHRSVSHSAHRAASPSRPSASPSHRAASPSVSKSRPSHSTRPSGSKMRHSKSRGRR